MVTINNDHREDQMNVYVVTVQGTFVEVYANEEDAEARRFSLYMGGANGAIVTHKVI